MILLSNQSLGIYYSDYPIPLFVFQKMKYSAVSEYTFGVHRHFSYKTDYSPFRLGKNLCNPRQLIFWINLREKKRGDGSSTLIIKLKDTNHLLGWFFNLKDFLLWLINIKAHFLSLKLESFST